MAVWIHPSPSFLTTKQNTPPHTPHTSPNPPPPTVLLGALYFQTGTSGISAVQNRLGLFMLEALFLAFTSVSALPVRFGFIFFVGGGGCTFVHSHDAFRVWVYTYIYIRSTALTRTHNITPQLFWLERPLYVHEHSNRYYGPPAYFVAKIFSDIIPVRDGGKNMYICICVCMCDTVRD